MNAQQFMLSILVNVAMVLAWVVTRFSIKLIWQSPRIFWWAGLYLKVGNKRYRLVKVGPR